MTEEQCPECDGRGYFIASISSALLFKPEDTTTPTRKCEKCKGTGNII